MFRYFLLYLPHHIKVEALISLPLYVEYDKAFKILSLKLEIANFQFWTKVIAISAHPLLYTFIMYDNIGRGAFVYYLSERCLAMPQFRIID